MSERRWGVRCRRCGGLGDEHRMHCIFYIGPLTHSWGWSHWNELHGAMEFMCTCGNRVLDYDQVGSTNLTCSSAHKAYRDEPVTRGQGF